MGFWWQAMRIRDVWVAFDEELKKPYSERLLTPEDLYYAALAAAKKIEAEP